jgi:hypothetical protein
MEPYEQSDCSTVEWRAAEVGRGQERAIEGKYGRNRVSGYGSDGDSVMVLRAVMVLSTVMALRIDDN